MAKYHEPVLLEEVLEILSPGPGQLIVDGNLGTGGHALALLEKAGPGAQLIGLDLDEEMLELAGERFREAGIEASRFRFVRANHAELGETLRAEGHEKADRILLDLGANSLHFDRPERGFALREQGPLDMRYDRRGEGVTAAQIVNEWSAEALERLFHDKGDEKWARRIALRLVERRVAERFETTTDLADAVAGAIPRRAWPPKIHPATRVFLALRSEVNREEESLERGLDSAVRALTPGGRLAVLTFQGNEDRRVKRRFRELSRDEIDPHFGSVARAADFRELNRKPIRPGEAEISQNPRSRSVKLRGLERKAG